MAMKIISAAKFKEQCLALLDEVDPAGIIVTKRGKPVAKLIPIEKSGRALIGIFKGELKPRGNLFATGVKWKARDDVEP